MQCARPSHVSASGNAVAFEGVTVRRGNVSILEEVNAVVPHGSCTIIVGPNGAGKTTLLLALLGDIKYRGTVRMDQPDRKNGRPRIGYVPQRVSVDRGMPLSVMEFLCMGIQKRPLWLGVSPTARQAAHELLERVHACHLAGHRLGALSGGEMQRVLLAQALQRKPDLLILDEPSAGVDLQGDHIFCELLEELRQSHGITQLMVSHDLGMVAHHATHVICLKRRVLAEGPPACVFTDEILTALSGMHMGILNRPLRPVTAKTGQIPASGSSRPRAPEAEQHSGGFDA